ncbi:MAG: aldehyde dehydrogenase family protein [Gemmataceae bacterium]|nr:aldehyde dehydrogenase family protein [Gemmata sp.]MDW8198744.1 aldehyde dehydrogenase family protein [Gemmataceae bacterium]
MEPFVQELAEARHAQQAWVAVPLSERLRCVRQLRGLIAEQSDAISAAIAADIARPATEVVATELLPTAAALKFLEKRAARLLAVRRVSWWDQPTWLFGCRDRVHRRPWGVVGIIGTWNYPFYLNVGPMAQALVAGNAVLWKPSENAVRIAELTGQLFRAAGFPTELVQTLPPTRAAGPRLAETDVDYLVFTGSDTVGRRLAARLGERLIPSTLELSGCDAMVVCTDANLPLAAQAAWFALALNRGQTCIAVRRILVPRQQLDAFLAAFQPLIRPEPLALVLESQKTQAERLIADAVARGASVWRPPAAKPAEPANALTPTILMNVPADAAICREACFAPVAAIIPFDQIDEAIEIIRQSPFGLSASIFSADTQHAQQLAARLPAGSVCINDILAPTAHPATPFGGRGASGWGVTQGPEGLLAMTVPQVVTVRSGTWRVHFDEAARPDPATGEILRGLLRWTHARSWRAKLHGLRQLLHGLRRKK